MRTSVRVVVTMLAALVVAVVWFARTRVGQEQESTPANSMIATKDEASSSNRTASLKQQSTNPKSAKDQELSALTSEDVRTQTPALSVAEDVEQYVAGETSVTAHKRLLPQAIESAGDVEAANEAERSGLLSLGRIGCEFEGGYNNGFIWDGKLQSGTASWQGGPIVYEAIDAEAGTAQMIGSAGATGSREGRADTQVAATPNRVEFLSNLENGHFVLTTVFGALDERGRYIAVMSRHEDGGYFGSQFLGSCK